MENNSLITIMTFTYAHESGVACALLDDEGIKFFLQDELTVNSNPLYSNAVGGIKLQVNKADAESAAQILEGAGFATDRQTNEIPFLVRFHSFMRPIPLINKLQPEAAFLAFSAFAICLFMIFIYLITV